MLIREIVQRVQSLYSKGVESDDSRLSSRHIYSKLLSARAKLIVQKINKRQKITQWNYQTLICVELVKALPYECPSLPPIGCKILRTKSPLPIPLMGLEKGHAIQSVTSLEGDVIFSETTWENKKYKSGNKYTSNKPDYYIRNNFLYITVKDGAKIISITGLFEDPIAAESFEQIGDKACEENTTENPCLSCLDILDREFPIEKDMVDTLVELAVNELISVFASQKEDITNNSRDTNIETSK